MEQTNLVKVVAAFVSGVVVALGSALIYVRVSDMVHPPPAVIPQTANNTSLISELPDTGPHSAPAANTSAQVASSEPETQTVAAVPRPSRKLPPSNPAHFAAVSRPVIAPKRESRGSFLIARNVPPISLSTTPISRQSAATPPERPSVADAEPQIQDGHQPLQPESSTAADAPSPQTAPPQPHVVTLPASTPVAIRLAETLSTDHNYQGDTFRATLESPIVADGFIIADRGSKVLGRVVTAEKSGRLTGVANLTLALTEINTTDKQRIRIDTSLYDKRGLGSNGENTAKIAGGAALGAIIGAIAGGGKGAAIGAGAGGAAGTGAVLLTSGKAAVLPVETRLSFRLNSPVTITEKLNY